ncbi:MAG: hypothetical protein KC466_18325 [Myxococcales bacterium]|nr:hypothetical protein [Myxococcales bacterium]
MTKRTLWAAYAAIAIAVPALGCFPAVSINTPGQGEGVDATAGVADVNVDATFSTPAPTAIVPGSLTASLTPLGQPAVDVSGSLSATTAGVTGAVPGVAVGEYTLTLGITNSSGFTGSAAHSFSVESDSSAFVGGVNEFSVTGVNDGCFLGLLGGLIPTGVPIGAVNIPSYAFIDANQPVTITLPAPPPIPAIDIDVGITSGVFTIAPGSIPQIDTGPITGGLLTCLLDADFGGVLHRTSDTTVDAVGEISNFVLSNPPGQTCSLPAPAAGCKVVLRLEGVNP